MTPQQVFFAACKLPVRNIFPALRDGNYSDNNRPHRGGRLQHDSILAALAAVNKVKRNLRPRVMYHPEKISERGTVIKTFAQDHFGSVVKINGNDLRVEIPGITLDGKTQEKIVECGINIEKETADP